MLKQNTEWWGYQEWAEIADEEKAIVNPFFGEKNKGRDGGF